MASPYGHQHRKIRLAVLERDNHRCHWCGGPADQADHLNPVAVSGGEGHGVDDYVASCGPCNSRRGARLKQTLARRRGRAAFFAGAGEGPGPVVSAPPAPATGPAPFFAGVAQ